MKVKGFAEISREVREAVMGARGPARKPTLQIIREGNQGGHSKERLAGGVKLRPARPDEPVWSDWFPDGTPGAEWAQRRASSVWLWAVGVLDPAGLLTAADALVLADLAVTWVRMVQAERDVSKHGLRQRTERGHVRNGSITTAGQYRTHWKWLCGQLGLSPVARDGMNGSPDDDEDSPFDV